jgi:hypothetical protein
MRLLMMQVNGKIRSRRLQRARYPDLRNRKVGVRRLLGRRTVCFKDDIFFLPFSSIFFRCDKFGMLP